MRPKDSRVQTRVRQATDLTRDEYCYVVEGFIDGACRVLVVFRTHYRANEWRWRWQKDQRAMLGENVQDGRNRSAD